MNSGRTVIDFGDTGVSDASVAVSQATIADGAIVHAWMDRRATNDHTAEEHSVERFIVTAGDVVAGTGFTVYLTLDGRGDATTTGEWAVCWSWSMPS